MGVSLLATIAAVTAALAPPAAPSTNARLGISDNAYHSGTPDQFWADIETLRPRIFRVNVPWNAVAPTRPAAPADPADPAYRWGTLDALVAGLAARKVTVLITVYGTPNWASAFGPATCDPPPDRGLYCQARAPRPRALGRFVRAVATRYSGTYAPPREAGPLPRVRLWEIWNEANNANFLVDGNDKASAASVAIYGEMLRASAQALRDVARPHRYSQVVIAGGVGGRLGLKHADFFRLLSRTEACRDDAGRSCFDAVSIHTYNGRPGLGLSDRPGAGYFSVGNFGDFERLAKRLWPSRALPIYVTEFGWQTNPPDPTFVGVTLQQQSLFLSETVDTFRARHPQVKALIWWLMEDVDVITNWQSGLRFLNGPTKPAYATFRRLAR